jgi:hypothetical protein
VRETPPPSEASIEGGGPAPVLAAATSSAIGSRPALPRLMGGRRLEVSPRIGHIALGAVIVATFAVVAVASSDPTVLVPRATQPARCTT